MNYQQRSGTRRKKKGFLSSILPISGYYCVCELSVMTGKKVLRNHWFNKKNEALDFVKSFKKKNTQIFVAQASFKKKGTKKSGRKQIYAAYLKVFFFDIDCGEGKAYASQAEGRKALNDFCKITGLPIPALVNSGNGYYAYWVLKVGIDADTWESVAEKLKKLVKAREPGLDQDGIIADSARILRSIGSFNRKDVNNPKKVTLVKNQDSISFKTFEGLLDKALAELPTLQTASESPDIAHDHIHEDCTQHISSSALKIVEHCEVLAMYQKLRGNVSEPIWYAMIGLLRHCIEAPQIIHEWSAGHPGYSVAETDNKIAQHKMPPTKCDHFATICPGYCCDCEHSGKINSPIVLGITKPVVVPDYIDNMNKDRFVGCFGGKTVVCREAFDETLNRRFLETSSFQDIKNLFNNQKINTGKDTRGNPISVPLGTAWLDHEKRRQFMEIKMLPEGAADGVYNLWRGYSIIPVRGSWKLMKKHIREVICNGDNALYAYVKKWMARMFQKPWMPGQVALVLQGGKGVGKGMLGNAICRTIGQHACHVSSIKHITGDFNSHLEDCIFLFADEAFWAGDKAAEGALKSMITEPTIHVTRKYCDGKQARNMLHLFMASNNEWVVPASNDERRYCVLKVSDRYAGDHDYFKALANETDNGGLEAMLFDLQELDISDFNVRAVPKTEGLTEQKLQSLDTVMSWWYQKLCEGELLPGIQWDSVPISSLYNDYVDSVQKQGSNIRRVSDTAFGKQLRKALPNGWPKKPRTRGTGINRLNHYEFPSLKTCREHFEKFMGDCLDWE